MGRIGSRSFQGRPCPEILDDGNLCRPALHALESRDLSRGAGASASLAASGLTLTSSGLALHPHCSGLTEPSPNCAGGWGGSITRPGSQCYDGEVADHSRPGPKETGVPLASFPLSPWQLPGVGTGGAGRIMKKQNWEEDCGRPGKGSSPNTAGPSPLSFLWGAIPSLGTLSPRRRPQAGERTVFRIPWLEEQISLLIDSCSPISFSPLPSG